MSNVLNIAKNFIVLSLSRLLSTGLSLVLVILITRFIGDEGYGKLGFAMSLAAILTVLTPLGMNSLMIREVARDKSLAGKYLGNTIIIELFMSVLAFAAIVIAIPVGQLPPDITTVLFICGGYYMLTSLSNAMRSIFSAHEKMEYTSLLDFTNSFITVACGAIVLLMGYGLISLAFAYLAAAVFDLLLAAFIVLRKFVHPDFRIDSNFWKKTIPIALPFAALALITAVYTQIDIIILRSIQDDATVGWYKASTSLVYTLNSIPALLASAIFPAMSRFHVSSKESLKLTVQKSAKYLLILAFPIAFGIAILAEPIINLLYGPDFIPGVPALRVLAFYVPFLFLNTILGIMLASIDKQRLRFFCYLGSTVIRIVLGIFLILNFSLTGAAFTIVASEALLFILNYYFSLRNIPGLNIIRTNYKPLIAGLGMAVFVFYLQDINVILLIIMAAIVYFTLFIIIRGFNNDDKGIAKDILSGIKGR